MVGVDLACVRMGVGVCVCVCVREGERFDTKFKTLFSLQDGTCAIPT